MADDLPLEPWPLRTNIAAVIDKRSDSLVLERLLHKKGITLDRLTEKLKLAAAIAPRQAAKIEARADAIIAREQQIEAKTDLVFAPHEELLTTAEGGLDQLDASLRLMSNDPLSDSKG